MTIRTRIIPALLALSFGAVSGLAYPQFNFWPAIFVSVAGLTWLAQGRGLLASAFLGLVAGMGFYTAQIYWISQYLGPVPLIALSLLQAIIFALGFVATTVAGRLLPSAIQPRPIGGSTRSASLARFAFAALVACIWVAREWLSTHWPYGGFPWARLAMSQGVSPLADYAFLGGISAISFVVAFIAVSALLVVQALNVRDVRGSIPQLAAVAIAFAVPLSFTPPIEAQHGTLTVAAVQGNANAGLFANSMPGSIFKKHLAASSLMLDQPATKRPDVVIWPENAVDVNPLGNASAALELNEFVARLDRPLILGTITQEGSEFFNSSLLWQPGTGLADQYDKKRPVPFAEYVPNRDFWAMLAPDLIGLIWHDYSFGNRDGIFEVAGTKLGVNICFEIAVDELNRDLVSGGARVIVSQTNNSDFGRSAETFQQAELARLRAIETGRAVVNDSTVGVTAVFLPNGDVLEQLEPFEPGYLQATVPLRSSLTPAYFVAPVVDATAIAASLAAIAAHFGIAWRKRNNAPRSQQRRSESGGQA